MSRTDLTYLKQLQVRYRKASKQEKTAIRVTGIGGNRAFVPPRIHPSADAS